MRKKLFKFLVRGWEQPQYIEVKGSFDESLKYEELSHLRDAIVSVELILL